MHETIQVLHSNHSSGVHVVYFASHIYIANIYLQFMCITSSNNIRYFSWTFNNTWASRCLIIHSKWLPSIPLTCTCEDSIFVYNLQLQIIIYNLILSYYAFFSNFNYILLCVATPVFRGSVDITYHPRLPVQLVVSSHFINILYLMYFTNHLYMITPVIVTLRGDVSRVHFQVVYHHPSASRDRWTLFTTLDYLCGWCIYAITSAISISSFHNCTCNYPTANLHSILSRTFLRKLNFIASNSYIHFLNYFIVHLAYHYDSLIIF